MRDFVARNNNIHHLRLIFLAGIILILCWSVLGVILSPVAAAHTIEGKISGTRASATTNCLTAADPTNQSLLVVLLDRSGSLTYEPGATDPNLYSTSVTKALAELWPGQMAVIPFAGNNTQLPIIGPATLSDPTQQTNLQQAVENYPIGGNTPLAPAMQEGLNLIQKQGTPAGSRVIIVTDGNPTGLGNNDGPHQETKIRQSLIRQYCNSAIPVSAFGLNIDTSTADGQDANRLLTDISTGTNAFYQSVRQPEELARSVIQLYAQWRHLSFVEATVQNGNAPVSVDSSAKNVTIVTFRSTSSTPVVLDGPDGQPIQGVQPAEDRHYVIDNFSAGSGVLVPGTYTVHTSGDSDVQVYELVDSTLQLQIVAPTAQEKLFDNKPVVIEAKFVDNGNDKEPAPGEATMVARVKDVVNGVQVSSIQIPLLQNGVIFKGQTPVYGKAGTLLIEVDGTDQGIERSSTAGGQLVVPPVPPPPPPPPCKLGLVGCTLLQIQKFWSEHRAQLVVGGLAVLLLLLLLFWLLRPAPFGELKRNPRSQPVFLGQGRRLGRRIFKKSIISSDELEADFPEFAEANFNLVFGSGRTVSIQSKNGSTPIRIMNKNTLQDVKAGDKVGVPLTTGSVIKVRDRNVATFSDIDS